MPFPEFRVSTVPFPETRWTVIFNARNQASATHRAALEELVLRYRGPILTYFRKRWRVEDADAEDLSQEFFEALLQGRLLRRIAPGKGRFRTYVMAALDNFLRMRLRHDSRRKRGGCHAHVSLEARAFTVADSETPEKIFFRAWARQLLQEALDEMHERYREKRQEHLFHVFILHDIERPFGVDLTHIGLGAAHGLSAQQVNNALYRARVHLRERLIERVRSTVDTEDQVLSELRDLFGRP